jgi:hypothetical protein
MIEAVMFPIIIGIVLLAIMVDAAVLIEWWTRHCAVGAQGICVTTGRRKKKRRDASPKWKLLPRHARHLEPTLECLSRALRQVRDRAAPE